MAKGKEISDPDAGRSTVFQNWKPSEEDQFCTCGAPRHEHKVDGKPARSNSICEGFEKL